jgi:hypothetical protein
LTVARRSNLRSLRRAEAYSPFQMSEAGSSCLGIFSFSQFIVVCAAWFAVCFPAL